MSQILVGVALVVVVAVVGGVLRSRRPVAAPTQAPHAVPRQLDRGDFEPISPWLVVVFTSASCQTCAAVLRAARPLGSPQVAVVEVEYSARRDLHDKYDVQAVPMVLVADTEGVVQTGIVGPVSAADLWAAVADARRADD